jgi:hypothetical protein
MTSIKSAMKMVGSRPLLLLTAVLFTTTTNALAPLTPGTIRVCQNKHCCKRNPQLSQIIANLVDGAVTVEASGCLSHCEEGPNVEIQWNGHESSTTLVTGVTDATTAAVQIELALKLAKPIPKLLVAASNVMERAINSPGTYYVHLCLFATATFFRVAIQNKIIPFLHGAICTPTLIVKERTA